MAVAATQALDAHKLRADFPVFEQLDPRQAARVPRLGRQLAEAAAGARRDARVLRDLVLERPPRRLHAVRARDRGATRARARSAGRSSTRRRRPRDASSSATRPRRSTSSRTRGGSTTSARATSSLVTELEHHSNFVPWQQIAEQTGADFRMIPIDDQGELRLDLLDEIAGDGNVKVVAANLVSNSLGTINPIEQARRVGARARGDHGRRRRPGRAAPPDRRADARRRLRRLLRRTRCAARAGSASSGAARELLESMDALH